MKLLLTIILFLFCFNALSQTPAEFDVLYSEKRFDKALEMAWEMTKTDSTAAFGYGQIGRTYNNKGKFDSGILYLQKAIESDGDRTYISGWGHANKGYALIMSGEKEKGISELNTAITLRKTTNCVRYAMHILDSVGAPMPGTQQTHLTKENLYKDIDVYGRDIEANHVYPFSVISKKDFFEHLEKIKDTGNLNVDEMYVALKKVNAEIEDEHTNMGYREPVLFPYSCHLFKEGIYIISADQSEEQAVFSRVIAVNHIPIGTVINKITDMLPDKNKRSIDEEAPKILSSPVMLHGLHIINSPGSVALTLVTQNNDTVLASFTPKKYFEIIPKGRQFPTPPLRYSQTGNYWYKYDSTGDFIYFNYSRCIIDSTYPFERFYEDFFKAIKENNPKKIVIDIRDNRGGSDAILRPFIDELSYSKYNKPHRIYVLMGRKTFSAAVNNLVYMMKTLTMTSIGEATSGSVNHYGSIKTFTLPNSGIEVNYSTKRITGIGYTNGPVKPNVIMPESIYDYIYGTDPALNYAIADE